MSTEISQEDFTKSIAHFEQELKLHCYRFMGSLQDSEDMLQETMLKAWNNRKNLKSRENQRAWMYKIATNVCLDHLRKQKRRGMPHHLFPPADSNAAFPPPINEPIWLEPYPTDQRTSEATQPEEAFAIREDISLAFMTTLHLLPPQQRAALILMNVLDWSALEVAETMGITVSAVNSLLYRARKKLKTIDVTNIHNEISSSDIDDVLNEYVEAWETSNIDKLTAILKEDARFTMPPFSCWYIGRDAIRTMIKNTLFANHKIPVWKLTSTQANGQPAFALYQLDPKTNQYLGFGIMVLTIHKEKIAEISAFLNPAIFPFFRLSLEL